MNILLFIFIPFSTASKNILITVGESTNSYLSVANLLMDGWILTDPSNFICRICPTKPDNYKSIWLLWQSDFGHLIRSNGS